MFEKLRSEIAEVVARELGDYLKIILQHLACQTKDVGDSYMAAALKTHTQLRPRVVMQRRNHKVVVLRQPTLQPQ